MDAPVEPAVPGKRASARPRIRAVHVGVVLVALAVAIAWILQLRKPFPADSTPEGAYARIALGVENDRPAELFAYLETEAQWASYTIRDMRKKARDRVLASYPEPERTALANAYRAEAEAPDGADVFAMHARRRGWMNRLRRDLSGIARVEQDGERATIETVRGTRYPFRRRDNGMWGLTIFTADLLADAERASRDCDVVEAAASDYDRARASSVSP